MSTVTKHFFSRETSRELKMCMLEIVLTKVVLQKDYNSHNTPLFETGCDFGPPPTPHSDLAWSQQNWRSEIPVFDPFWSPHCAERGPFGGPSDPPRVFSWTQRTPSAQIFWNRSILRYRKTLGKCSSKTVFFGEPYIQESARNTYWLGSLSSELVPSLVPNNLVWNKLVSSELVPSLVLGAFLY